MNIKDASDSYEAWLGRQTALVADDVKRKHRKMASDTPFPFLRATFYRWAQRWRKHCADLADAPAVLGVGDLHVENFGTWRDADGRLVWGVNDFDEACDLPYPSDLVRLATSAHLAAAEGAFSLSLREACEAILTGYVEGMRAGRRKRPPWKGRARPFIIDAANRWLAVLADARDPATFWQNLRRDLKDLDDPKDAGRAADVLRSALPHPSVECKLARRSAGVGSLGRPRFVALGDFHGWPVAREAKAVAPSAWPLQWAQAGEGSDQGKRGGSRDAAGPKHAGNPDYERVLSGAVRSPDPWVRIQHNWVVRRLAPDCDKLDLPATANVADEARLVRAMGRETANIHLSTGGAAETVLDDLKKRPADWLRAATRKMVKDTVKDWEQWREAHAKEK